MPFSLLRSRPEARRTATLVGGALLPEGEARRVYLGGQLILVAHVEGRFYAISALCTHWPELIDPASLRGCEVRCPVHWATFDVRTGKATGGPTRKGVAVFPVRVVGEDLLIEFPE
ncbi:MAG: (2Fe-2S)-binding protein [Dehalococcoidia bacterium]|nr:MAG: (2Fe-2S)-binding protein [Dehalococcoidia bacterium]